MPSQLQHLIWLLQLPCCHTFLMFPSISDNQQMQTRLDMSCLMLNHKKSWYARGYSCSSLTLVANEQYHDGQHLATRVLHQSSGSPKHLWSPAHDGRRIFTVWRSLSKSQLGLDDTTSKTEHASGDMLKMKSESTIAARGCNEDNSMICISCPANTRQTLTANGRPQRGRMLSPRAYFWSIAMASAITFKERYIKIWTCRCNLSAECMTTDCMDWERPCLLPSIKV